VKVGEMVLTGAAVLIVTQVPITLTASFERRRQIASIIEQLDILIAKTN
jgi:DNA-binding transcriptional MocR family regulator